MNKFAHASGAAAACVLLVLLGCGTENEASRKANQPALPTLGEGKSLTVEVSDVTGSIAREEFTLTELKTTESLYDETFEQAQPAEGKFVCAEFKIKNVGSTEGDSTTTGKRVGADGKVQDLGFIVGISCRSLGMADSLHSPSNPKAGQYVMTSVLYDVPTQQPGAIVVSDGGDSQLFRINYAPESARVKITE
ncbi:hypothetical protein [Actinomadura sp. 3N407]|uniref:hypothetical protein n=1 Tax=Actinomadura sp. 3N407 TaxID=3457423 RepID=UPI003FCE7000